MSAVTVRNIKPETHQALRERAQRNGRSTEAEIRLILEEAVSAPVAVDWVSELAAIGREFNITTEFDNLRDKTPARIISFE